MLLFVTILGVLIMALGLLGLAAPNALVRYLRQIWERPSGLYIAVIFRLLMGVVLFWAAPDSRFPITLKILGAITILAAVAIPFVGYAKLTRFLHWFTELGPGVMRAWALVAIAFGAFLVYASWGNPALDSPQSLAPSAHPSSSPAEVADVSSPAHSPLLIRQ